VVFPTSLSLSHRLTTVLSVNTAKYTDYVPDHFKNQINSSSVHSLSIFQIWWKNPPTTFRVILLADRQRQQLKQSTLAKSGREIEKCWPNSALCRGSASDQCGRCEWSAAAGSFLPRWVHRRACTYEKVYQRRFIKMLPEFTCIKYKKVLHNLELKTLEKRKKTGWSHHPIKHVHLLKLLLNQCSNCHVIDDKPEDVD